MKIVEKYFDVIVVGSGGAGSSAAVAARAEGRSVLLVSKDPINCSDSKISEGIITVRGSETSKDTEAELNSNIRIQGDDIGNAELAKVFAHDSKDAYEWLRRQGLKPHFDKNGKVKTLGIAMGGHTHSRSVDHVNGGLDYAHALRQALTENREGSLEFMEDAWFLDLYVSESCNRKYVQGGLIYHAADGVLVSVKAHAVVLACGGIGTLYFPHTDTMRGNTGDAYAIAARAGAKLVDMEQIQFIPFAVASPPSYQGLIVGEPVSAGALGVIRDVDGKVILSEIMARTRAECAAAIAQAVEQGKGTINGGCYLDLTDNIKGESADSFRHVMKTKAASLLKIVRLSMGSSAANFEIPWEVKPSAHYCMGGIETDANGQVLDANKNPLIGLFAAGQALGGLHGSNRLGSTSLAEAIIFGRRSGYQAANLESTKARQITNEKQLISHYLALFGRQGESYGIDITRQLQKACWSYIGPARNEVGMHELINQITMLNEQLECTTVSPSRYFNQSFLDVIEARNLLQCSTFIVHSALNRSESMGAHFRTDSEREKGSLSPFSVQCFWGDNRELEIRREHRKASPKSAHIKLKLQQGSKIIMLKLLRHLPVKLRDPILTKKYAAAAGESLKESSNEA